MKLPILIATFICLLCTSISAQTATRIKFEPGADTTKVTGTLSGYRDKKIFLIKVNAGQTISTEQPGTNDITLSIQDPTGKDVSDADASCNNRKSISPTVAGDYRILVTECGKADEWSGKFTFSITVR